MIHSTHVIPFKVEFKAGRSPFRQTVYAVKKALAGGQLQPGHRFPSVRTLSRELRINPNTAHKVVAELVRDGVLEVRPGIGTVVREDALAEATNDASLLDDQIERLAVEAIGLGLSLEAVQKALAGHWHGLSPVAAARSDRNRKRTSQ